MSEFSLIFIWLFAMWWIYATTNVFKYENVCGNEERRATWQFALITVLPIIVMVALRNDNFGDTMSYRQHFADMPSAFSGMASYMSTVSKDKGFQALSIIIKCIFGNHDVVYFGILAIIQIVCIVKTYRKYSPNYMLSIFLFLASSDYVAWMFNGIRQFTAAALMFAAAELIVRKRFVPSLMVILLAATMHQSALIMIPIIIICQGEAWNLKTLLFIVLILLAVFYVDRFTDFLDDVLVETQYTNVVSDFRNSMDDGTNPIRVLFYSVPTLLALVGARYIKTANNPMINICANMSLVSTGLYVVSMVTSGIFLGRLPIYASLYNYILLPWLIESMFEKRSARLVTIIVMGTYLLFYYYQMHMTWGLI